MRILEIGAGTGNMTSTILPQMTPSTYRERMYSTYTYTDISADVFNAAKERFKDVQGMKYAVLDICKDPIEQGFEAQSFGLIVASNVLHNTPSLHESLSNVMKLLHPRVRLFLHELSPTTKWSNLVMGRFASWWVGDGDDRSDEPYVTSERWEKELKPAGFVDINAVKTDGQLNNTIVAMPACDKYAVK
ncbi:putative polyketide synthase [Apodospora peruviana]|uniref:Polyketide synthase n=1 Tax=Apodospora peruviana TaxID=516989 RepID=A0AAE0I4E5_9PEZI|nr:putative polyketide synthase [Apodospora peruviana]